MPCKIHSPALISAHPDLRARDRRFVCGFIGESGSRIAASQFKGCVFLYRGEAHGDSMSKQLRY